MAAVLTVSGSNITSLKISRPSWNAKATKAVPTASGEDRRHVIAWWAMRERIVGSIVGKSLQAARTYLSGLGIDAGGSSKSDIEWGIWELAKQLFNQVDNLWPGAAKPNRFLGCHIIGADELMENRATLQYPVVVDVDVPDENGGSSSAKIPLNSPDQVIDWLFNMAVDWEDGASAKQGAAAFEQFLQSRGI